MDSIINVHVRPCHRQHAADIRKTVQGCQTDCVFICGERRIGSHKTVLSIATGLLQKSNCDEIILNERYLPLLDKVLILIYIGHTSFPGDLLPLFRRMNRSIQMKLTIAYQTIVHPPSNSHVSNEPSCSNQYPYFLLQGQENEAVRSVPTGNSQIPTNHPNFAPLDVNQSSAGRSCGLDSIIPYLISTLILNVLSNVISSEFPTGFPSMVPCVTGMFFTSLDVGNVFEQFIYDAILFNEMVQMRFYAQNEMTHNTNYLNEVLAVLVLGI
ncbi:hypothetical protein TCAL_12333 [Tigriopus californicus]|uniref:BTB domain-containing protein n=1 Tax=Tigriopus californicus TaxID=6832 RepID=A0A553PU02_TIGCA|nr:uncharacterized protein LOC131891660 isoform X1 [Tigriopus californicus]TRY81161.1 hypothetical protein TCAL_12333 [Tigriopus californicus]|eukprot:TCALIF_12333-PA protein Name:"Protein of unknown function" AED:0.00 eAED:0.00 QI:4/1/1/1/1/1/3/84/268